jgi:hypothetical protein
MADNMATTIARYRQYFEDNNKSYFSSDTARGVIYDLRRIAELIERETSPISNGEGKSHEQP